ncbi:MAG: ATP-binding protein [Desulfohalobiaceae bacterium]|nr:ATP-binding protein [Desulfohalobiaceae bacterium]
MRIAIASGKGGTGKTTVAVNLACYLRNLGREVTLVDCDVEEPNCHYFLSPEWDFQQAHNVPVPSIDQDACRGESCLLCVRECRYNALIWMVNHVMTFPELCHGCGLCSFLCPEGAISEITRETGIMRGGKARGIDIYSGSLNIKEAMAPPLINQLKSLAPRSGTVILDAPPGTSCPAVATVHDADYVILVAEPTPFGLHDFKLSVDVLKQMELPFGLVINRDGMGDNSLLDYAKQEGIPVLARLPHSREAARSYSTGKILIEDLPDFIEQYEQMVNTIYSRQKA